VVVSGSTGDTMLNSEQAEPPGTGDEHIIAWLQRVITPKITLICICSGAILAGRAGLLDGKACTTHFGDCATLARLAPKAKVHDNRLFVQDGNCLTSAGVTAGIDLMLYVVAQATSPAIAARIARHLVVYMRRDSHAAQISPWLDGRNHIHPAIHRVQDAITANPAADWTQDAMADIAATSPRHLLRLFHQATGMTPIDFVNRLRIALAKDLIATSHLHMEAIAERAGFSSSRHFRRAWSKIHTEPPRAFRRSQVEGDLTA
jgi:transcriptional regulator GlxA family with amidase domain